MANDYLKELYRPKQDGKRLRYTKETRKEFKRLEGADKPKVSQSQQVTVNNKQYTVQENTGQTLNDIAKQNQANKNILAGKGSAQDVLGGNKSVELTKENIAAIQKRAQIDQEIKLMNEQERKSNLRNSIIENQANASYEKDAQKSDAISQEDYLKSVKYISEDTDAKRLDVKISRWFERTITGGLTPGKKSGSDIAVSSGAFAVSTAYYTGKTAVEGVLMTVNPIAWWNTGKDLYSLATNKETRSQTVAAIQDTVSSRPDIALGTTLGIAYTPKVAKETIAVGQKYVVIAQKTLKNKRGAVFFGDRSTKAGQRASPISQAQKSKIARQQYFNSKLSRQGNILIEKTGKANKNRNYFKAEADVLTAAQVRKGSKSGAGRSVITTIESFNKKTGNVERSLNVELISKGQSQTPKGVKAQEKLFVRNAQGKELAVYQKGQTQLITKQTTSKLLQTVQPKRIANNKINPTFNNPSTVGEQQSLVKPLGVSPNIPKLQNKRVALNRREARFFETKQRLRKVGQQRLNQAQANKQYAELPSTFFEIESKAITQTKTRTVSKPLASSVPGTTKPRFVDVESLNPKASSFGSYERNYVSNNKNMNILESTSKKTLGFDNTRSNGIEILRPDTTKRIKGKRVKVLKQQPNIRLGAQSGAAISQIKATGSIVNQLPTFAAENKSVSKNAFDIEAKADTKRTNKTLPNLKINSKQNQDMKIEEVKINEVKIIPVRTTNNRRKPDNRKKPEPPKQTNNTIIDISNRNKKQSKSEKIVPRFDQPRPEKKTGLVEAYNVYVRRKGKFILASAKKFSKGAAIDFGSSVVGNTAAASFQIVKTTGATQETSSKKGIIGDFYKKKPNLYIEKRGRRIKSSGEKQEITFAPRKKVKQRYKKQKRQGLLTW